MCENFVGSSVSIESLVISEESAFVEHVYVVLVFEYIWSADMKVGGVNHDIGRESKVNILSQTLIQSGIVHTVSGVVI